MGALRKLIGSKWRMNVFFSLIKTTDERLAIIHDLHTYIKTTGGSLDLEKARKKFKEESCKNRRFFMIHFKRRNTGEMPRCLHLSGVRTPQRVVLEAIGGPFTVKVN